VLVVLALAVPTLIDLERTVRLERFVRILTDLGWIGQVRIAPVVVQVETGLELPTGLDQAFQNLDLAMIGPVLIVRQYGRAMIGLVSVLTVLEI
jgi:hypothetical protein